MMSWGSLVLPLRPISASNFNYADNQELDGNIKTRFSEQVLNTEKWTRKSQMRKS